MVLGPFVRKVIPYVNFIIASSALCFQIFALYPWHLELDKDFRKMQEDHNQTLEEYHQKKLKRLEEIEQNILRLEAQHHRNEETRQKILGFGFFFGIISWIPERRRI